MTTYSFPPPGYLPTESAIEGIEIFRPKPAESGLRPEVVEFTCPQCGSTTAFSAANGSLVCASCGYQEQPDGAVVGRRADEFEFTVETVERSAQGWGEARKEVECQNCGAHTSVPPDALTLTCPFCASNKVIQREAGEDVLRPRFVIPFKVDAPACQHVAGEWLGSSWMTPKSLKSAASLACFSGVYLPYWTFDAVTRAEWRAQVGHEESERYLEGGEWKTRTRTVWRWESGNVQLTHDDLLIVGTKRLSPRLLSKINNFDLNDLCPYEPRYLAGLQAQAYETPLEEAWEAGRQEMRNRTHQACLDQASTSKVRNFSMSLDFADESWRYILLPVYLSTYVFEGKTYQALINAQTGAIEGQRPVDWKVVYSVIAILLVPGGLLSLVGLLTAALGIGLGIGAIGLILLLIGAVISLIIFFKAQAMDDL